LANGGLRLHIEHILEIKGKILEINKNGKKWELISKVV